jgi:hypothetical protein
MDFLGHKSIQNPFDLDHDQAWSRKIQVGHAQKMDFKNWVMWKHLKAIPTTKNHPDHKKTMSCSIPL